MNKKAVFISLTAALILGIIIFMLISRVQQSTNKSDLNVQYSKHKYAADYINDVENIYLPSLISISEKFALRNISRYISKEVSDLKTNLTYVVMTGYIDNNTNRVMSDDHTLPVLINKTFSQVFSPIEFQYLDFDVISIGQKDNRTIIINSSVNFSVSSEGVMWKNTINYSTDISVNGLTHWKEGKIITKKWVENDTKPCILELLDGASACSADISGLCPLAGCS